jgi:hypothetical protein
VRRWLRRASGERHLAGLYSRGVARIHQLDPEILSAGLRPQPTRLGDALQALAAVAHAYRRRVDQRVDGWALIGAFTAGRLLAPGPQVDQQGSLWEDYARDPASPWPPRPVTVNTAPSP